jgi:hypothetical protein
MKKHKLITLHETHKNFKPIGSIELKLAVARAEGCKIKMQQTKYHHIVDGTTVTSVDESKPTYYYYDDLSLSALDPYLVAMEFYLKEKGITDSDFIHPKENKIIEYDYTAESERVEYWQLVGNIINVIRGTPHWEKREEILWYVSRCEMAGFAETADEKQNCALRYMAGKRKVSAPGTKRRKRSLQEQRKMLRNLSPQLVAAINAAALTDLAKQFIGGNAKAMNALIGSVLKEHKAPAALIKQLLETKMKEKL